MAVTLTVALWRPVLFHGLASTKPPGYLQNAPPVASTLSHAVESRPRFLSAGYSNPETVRSLDTLEFHTCHRNDWSSCGLKQLCETVRMFSGSPDREDA